MHRIDRIHVFGVTGVARHAARVNFFGRVILKDENLGNVPPASNVCRSWPVAALASLV
jgi:hypothetical protein